MGEAALEILRAYALPLVPRVLAADVDAAAGAAAAGLGYPVALKIISPAWVHMSDWGGVRLNVNTETDLRQAHRDLARGFRRSTPDAALDGILVQKQVQGVELLMGLNRDPQFGPCWWPGPGGFIRKFSGMWPGLGAHYPRPGCQYAESTENLPHSARRSGTNRGGPPGPGRGPGQPLPISRGLPGNPGTGPQPRGGRTPGLLVRGLPDSAGRVEADLGEGGGGFLPSPQLPSTRKR